MLNEMILYTKAASIDPEAFNIGGWSVRWYGLIIGLGIVVAYFLFNREGKRKGIDENTTLDLIFWTVMIGFIGARLYYVLFRLDYYLANPGQIIQIWQGGLAIYGGIIAGVITLIVLSRRYQLSMMTVLDIAAPSVLAAQAIGRWGNFMNQEAHGGPVAREFLESLFLPEFIIEQMNINGVYHHPTFLYESLWNIIGVALLLVLRRKSNFFRQGEVAASYLIWYGVGRAFIEGLRTDSLYLGSLRVSQWLSVLSVIASIALIIYRRTQVYPPVPYYEADEIAKE